MSTTSFTDIDLNVIYDPITNETITYKTMGIDIRVHVALNLSVSFFVFIVYVLFLVLSLIVFIGRKSYRLWFTIYWWLRSCLSRNNNNSSGHINGSNNSRGGKSNTISVPPQLLLHGICFFIFYRCISSLVHAVKYTHYTHDFSDSSMLIQLIGFPLFLWLYGGVILLWLRIAMAWSTWSRKKEKALVYSITAFITVVCTLVSFPYIVIFLVNILYLAGVPGLERKFVRNVTIMYVYAPIYAVGHVMLTVLCIVIAVRIILMMRHTLRVNRENMMEDQVRQQKLVMFKMGVCVLVFTIAVNIRVCGAILMAINIATWVFYAFVLGIPEWLSFGALFYLMWPYKSLLPTLRKRDDDWGMCGCLVNMEPAQFIAKFDISAKKMKELEAYNQLPSNSSDMADMIDTPTTSMSMMSNGGGGPEIYTPTATVTSTDVVARSYRADDNTLP